MRISVVIPNWNGAEKLRKNLPAVLKLKGIDEIIVSDDGSSDDSVTILKNEFPQIKLMQRMIQGGFSTNVNEAVKNAQGDFVFILNSDASPDSDCLRYVLPHFNSPKVFSVGCNVGGSWSWAKWQDGFFWHFMKQEKLSSPHQTLWASGGSGMFRKSIWDELRGFDENFNPFYEEDVDLGYRATKRGYINIFEPRSKVEHYKMPGVIAQNYSHSTIAKIAQRNQLLFIWKNITDPAMINQHQLALVKMLLAHPKYGEIFLKALVKLPQVFKLRNIEQKASKFSDTEILNKFTS